MATPTPAVTLVRAKDSQRWVVEVRDFSGFLDRLGDDVVAAFARCFVHGDRLVSLTSFAYHSLRQYPEDSPAFGRNLQTMVWFVVGTLRELATAIRGLRSALARRGLLDPDSSPWLKLRTLEDRWENDPFFRQMRNSLAFHVDLPQIERGLQVLRQQDRVVIMQGDGEKQDGSTLRLGLEAFFLGEAMDLPEFDRFVATVATDHGEATAIAEAFYLALNRVGLAPSDETHGA